MLSWFLFSAWAITVLAKKRPSAAALAARGGSDVSIFQEIQQDLLHPDEHSGDSDRDGIFINFWPTLADKCKKFTKKAAIKLHSYGVKKGTSEAVKESVTVQCGQVCLDRKLSYAPNMPNSQMRIKFQLDNLQKCFQCLAALEAIPPHSPSLFGVISNGPNDRMPRPQYGWTIWKQKEIEDLVRVNAMEQVINGLPKEDLDKKVTEDDDTRFRDKAYLLLLGRSESEFVDMAVENVMGYFYTARPSTFCSSPVNATYEEDRIEFDRAVEYLQMAVYKSHLGLYMGILFEGCSQAKKKITKEVFNKHWLKTLCIAFDSHENFDSPGEEDGAVESAFKSFTLKYIRFLLADVPDVYNKPEEVWQKTLDGTSGSIPALETKCKGFAQTLAVKHGWNRDLPKEHSVITPEAGSSQTLSPAPSAR